MEQRILRISTKIDHKLYFRETDEWGYIKYNQKPKLTLLCMEIRYS